MLHTPVFYGGKGAFYWSYIKELFTKRKGNPKFSNGASLDFARL